MKYDLSLRPSMALRNRLSNFTCDKDGIIEAGHRAKHFAKGNFGRVYRLNDAAYGLVALKYIQPPQYGGVFAQGLIEIRAQLLINNVFLKTNTVPHFCPLYTYQSSPKYSLLAMPFFEDGTLHSFLRRSKTRICELAETVLFQVTISLAWLQAVLPGFRHNDLKTDNVLCRRDHRPNTAVDYYYSPVGRLYAVPTCGIWTYIADFGHTHCTGIVDSVDMVETCLSSDEGNFSVLPKPGADLYYFVWSMFNSVPELRSTELGMTLNMLYYGRLFGAGKTLPSLPEQPPTENEVLSLLFNRWETLEIPTEIPFGEKSVEELQAIVPAVRLPSAVPKSKNLIPAWFGGKLPETIDLDYHLPGHAIYSVAFISTPDPNRIREINKSQLRTLCEEYQAAVPTLQIEELYTQMCCWIDHFVNFLDGISASQSECLMALTFHILIEKPVLFSSLSDLSRRLCTEDPYLQEALIAQFLWLHKLALIQ